MNFEAKNINESYGFESELKSLRGEIKESSQDKNKWIITSPEIVSGAAVFQYENPKGKYEIVTRKENGVYKLRIKKWVKLPTSKMGWQTQKFGNNETFDFRASDKVSFFKNAFSALNGVINPFGEFTQEALDAINPFIHTDMPNISILYDYMNTGYKVYDLLNNPNGSESKVEVSGEKTDLKKKPIDLNYTEKNKEKHVSINFPQNNYSVEGRVTRCLRWGSITDAVEDRYGIPRGLLMALMAQEGWGDPTVINQKSSGKCDGGAGLIHMQAINAANFGLNTLPRSNYGMIDYKHGEKLKKAKSDNHNDLKKLSNLDDRFNPVLSVDASARFLINEYNNLPQSKRGTDRWLHAVNKYAGRGMQDYGYSVVVYRTTISSIRGNPIPQFTQEIEKVKAGKVSARINQQRERTDLCINRTKEAINNLNIKIGDQSVSYSEFMKYQAGQCDNYGLSDYKKFNTEHPYKK